MDDLADIIDAALPEVKADIGDYSNEEFGVEDSLHGAKTLLVHRTHEILCRGLPPEEQPAFAGVEKQVWHVFSRRNTEAVDLGVADAMLMACGRMLGNEDLPVFPHNKENAVDMIQTHFDLAGEDVDSTTVERLACKLYNFTQGFLNGPLAFEDELALMRETQREKERVRKQIYRNLTKRRQVSTSPGAVAHAKKARAEEAEVPQDFPSEFLNKLAMDRFYRMREVKRRGGRFIAR